MMWKTLLPCVCLVFCLHPSKVAGFEKRQSYDDKYDDLVKSVSTKTWRVTSILGNPYLRIREAGSYEGYIKDLLDLIFERLNSSYIIHPVKDGRYGSAYTVGNQQRWNGMIGEVVEGEADMAAGPLTITPERDRVVDFTRPFMYQDLVAVIKRQPYGRDSRYQNIDDMIHDSDFEFLVIFGGRTAGFVTTSKLSVLRRMAERLRYVTNFDEGFQIVRSEEKVAVITTSDVAEYAAQQSPCDLRVVSLGLRAYFEWAYGLALPEDSPYVEVFSAAISELREEGVLARLYKKWYFDKGWCGVQYNY